MRTAPIRLFSLVLFGLATTTAALPPPHSVDHAANALGTDQDGVHAGVGTNIPEPVKQHLYSRVSTFSSRTLRAPVV